MLAVGSVLSILYSLYQSKNLYCEIEHKSSDLLGILGSRLSASSTETTLEVVMIVLVLKLSVSGVANAGTVLVNQRPLPILAQINAAVSFRRLFHLGYWGQADVNPFVGGESEFLPG